LSTSLRSVFRLYVSSAGLFVRFCSQNVAAVTSTSTRTPIYKAFAKGENIGDVTAKGECVGNIADLVCFWTFSNSNVGILLLQHCLQQFLHTWFTWYSGSSFSLPSYQSTSFLHGFMTITCFENDDFWSDSFDLIFNSIQYLILHDIFTFWRQLCWRS